MVLRIDATLWMAANAELAACMSCEGCVLVPLTYQRAYVKSVVGLALRALNPVPLVDGLDSLGPNGDPVEELGHESRDDEETLYTLLELPPVRALERRRDEDGVEVEVRGEERAGQERRGAKVRGLDRGREVREGLTVERGVGLCAGLRLARAETTCGGVGLGRRGVASALPISSGNSSSIAMEPPCRRPPRASTHKGIPHIGTERRAPREEVEALEGERSQSLRHR